MCGDLDVIAAGRRATERVLAGLGVPVAKAMNLATATGFDQAVARLASLLRRRAEPREVEAVRAAVAELDVDWRRTTAEQRRRLIAAAMEAAGRRTALVPQQIRASLRSAGHDVIDATRSHARRAHGLAIGAEFSALDGRVVDHVVRSHGNFVRDAYGRRLDAFGQRARTVVAEGLAAGLGRDDIAANLARAARAELVERAPYYWETVASSFIGRGRSFGQLSSYAEAGIERYQVIAVLDERTTAFCRFVHLKTFSVGVGLDLFTELERAEPEAIRQRTPWVRERTSGDRHVLYVDHASGRRDLATVLRSVGARDDVGHFRALADDSALIDLGLTFPPFHGHCRTACIPLIA